jgi:hypothetical protein
MIFLSTVSGETGCLPFNLIDGKQEIPILIEQGFAAPFDQRLSHRVVKWHWLTTGLCLDLSKPIAYARASDGNLQGKKIYIVPA